MKTIGYIILLLAFTVVACKQQKKTAEKPAEKQIITKSAEPKLLFTFRKSVCYGYCPAYYAEVYSDGLVKYEGKAHVKNIGKFEFKAPKEFTDMVMNKAIELDFVNLKDKYESGVPDFPSSILTIYQGDMVKTVEFIDNAPEEVTIYFNDIHDELCKITDCKIKQGKSEDEITDK